VTVLARKLRTFRRVVRQQGVSGVVSALRDRVNPLVESTIDYAKLAPSALTLLSRHGRPDMFLTAVGAGIGDDLLCTAVFRELRRRGRDRFWVTTRYPQLYEGNADIPVVVPAIARYDLLLQQLGVQVVYPWYTSYHPAFDRDDPMPQQHLISIMCQKAGITGDVTLRPYLTLTPDEARRGRLVRRQVAIQSAGLDALHAMRNKNWVPERYQQVVSALRDRYDFVQVGSSNDPPLEGALDLRGRTTIRETAAILGASQLFVGQVGFLMHLARAVDCRSVIVYGGRETPAQSGYPCNVNLYSPVACSPCWRLNTCPFERICLQMIEVDDVVQSIEAQAGAYGSPLACDVDTITAEQVAYNAERHAHAVAAHRAAWATLYQ
jgi:hypothetical protein